MDETPTPFHEDRLSPEDLAILRDFDAMEFIADEQPAEISPDVAPRTPASSFVHTDATEEFSDEDMLLLFISEIEEDVSVLRNSIQQVTPGEELDSVRLQVLERKAHKIKGTAGAFGCDALSTIARYTEILSRMITQGSLIDLSLLVQAISALDGTLISLVTTGKESREPLEELEAAFNAQAFDIASAMLTALSFAPASNASEQETSHITSLPPHTLASHSRTLASPISVRVELARFEQLLMHTGQLTDLQVPLRNAQVQVEVALQELHAAQARLTRLESRYSTFPLSAPISDNTLGRYGDKDTRPASSMIANILNEAEERLGHRNVHKEFRENGEGKEPGGRFRTRHFSTGEPLSWDEMEIDRYTETDALKNVLSEAIADVVAASAQLRTAFEQLNDALRKQMSTVMHVRRDTLSLRLAPLSSLSGRIERVVAMNDKAQEGSIHFEMRGETTEIDQEMLEELKNPLLHLARACVFFPPHTPEHTTPGLLGEERSGHKEVRVWFHAVDLGHEVTIEIGSSMNVESGAVNEVQDTLRRLHGSIIVLRNSAGGMSFHLRLPRSQGSLRGLLVQAGSQQVVVPFAQIQRIDYGVVENTPSFYKLSHLLDVSAEPLFGQRNQQMFPVLVMHPESVGLRVQVDAIVGEVEQVVKPLAPYVRRVGIAGTIIDDGGDVLLVVNLAELIRHTPQQRFAFAEEHRDATSPLAKSRQQVVLVADDSVSIRGSLLQSLTNAGYRAFGVDDGMEALEFLLDHAPDVLLLDIEMPYLNGYDLLSIMSAHEHLARVKTIMLTSRSSEKHRQRAMELGADAYLTKPCPQDVLLRTIESLSG